VFLTAAAVLILASLVDAGVAMARSGLDRPPPWHAFAFPAAAMWVITTGYAFQQAWGSVAIGTVAATALTFAAGWSWVAREARRKP
jgi:hypothetical protein